ncbi:hypothetical protein PO909_000056 [Leuciscus waleckii]
MFALGLLSYVVLSAFSAQAEVVRDFNVCKEFFYLGKAPEGMDQNTMKICQRYDDDDAYYATLYSVHHKIPLYSAYTMDSCSDTKSKRTDKWHLEPQISKPDSEFNYMVPDDAKNRKLYKADQAIGSDYNETGYDRGHLYPNSFPCTQDGRNATNTLTNAVPMDPCFNRVHWKDWESTLKRFLKKKLKSDDGSAKAYIVTGEVPDEKLRIPQREKTEDSMRVTVPSHIWTAVCYKHYIDDESFSFSFIGENLPGNRISLMSVSALNNKLNELYKVSQRSIEIFNENCFEKNSKLNEAEKAFQKLINLPLNPGVQATPDVQNTYHGPQALNPGVQATPDVQNTYHALQAINTDGLPAGENVEVTEMNVKLALSNLSTYSAVAERLKTSDETPCLITNYNYGQESVECQFVPKKRRIAADGSLCLSIPDSGSGFQCNTKGGNKRFCSSPCLYWDKPKGYWCNSGQTLIACSPPYSLVTAKGERCLDDHPCATYGYDYYWCETSVSDHWDYCSPPLWSSKAVNGQYCRRGHACAKYGESYQWCYTDNEGSYGKCCTSDDPYSTVSGKICKPYHPCDYYGEDNLWCYTTDGSRDYCCTKCEFHYYESGS